MLSMVENLVLPLHSEMTWCWITPYSGLLNVLDLSSQSIHFLTVLKLGH